MNNIKTGAELIAAERQRQMDYDASHDAQYTSAQLIHAAQAYTERAESLTLEVRPLKTEHEERYGMPEVWPWCEYSWKPSDDPVRNLVKAGALIAAEIDRLQRHGAKLQPL